eukprot:gene15326-21410_t
MDPLLNTILKDKNAFSPGAISDPKGEGLTSTAPPAALSATDESNGGGMLARFEVFRKNRTRRHGYSPGERGGSSLPFPSSPYVLGRLLILEDAALRPSTQCLTSSVLTLLQTTPPPTSLGLPSSHQPPPPHAPSKSFLSDDEDDY